MALYNYYVDRKNGNNSWDGTAPEYVSGTTGPWQGMAALYNNKTAGQAWQTKANGGDKVIIHFKGPSEPVDPDSKADFLRAYQNTEVHGALTFGTNDFNIIGTNASVGAEFEITSYGDNPAIFCTLVINIMANQDAAFPLASIYECDYDGPDPSVARPGSGVWRIPGTTTTVNALWEDGQKLKRAHSIAEIGINGNAYWERNRSTGAGIALYYKPAWGVATDHILDRNATPVFGYFKDCSNVWIHGLMLINAPIDAVQGTPASTQNLSNIKIYDNIYRWCTPRVTIDAATAWEIDGIEIYNNDIQQMGADAISVETNANGDNPVKNVSIHDNLCAYMDHDGRHQSWFSGYADYLGLWNSGLTPLQRDVVHWENDTGFGTKQIRYYRNITGSNGVSAPPADTTNWAILGLTDNEGIVVQNPENVHIYKNECHHGFAGGAIVLWAHNTAGLSKNVFIYRNDLHDLEGMGISAGTGIEDQRLTNCWIFSNKIYDYLAGEDGVVDSPGEGDGIRLNGYDSTRTLYVFNNVMDNLKTGINLNSAARGWNCRNNILRNCSDQFVKRYETNGMDSFLGNNVYYNTDATEKFNYKGTIYNFANWKTQIQADTFDDNDDTSQVADPLLDADYFPAPDSPVWYAGVWTGKFLKDFGGRPFKAPNPSIGLWEAGSRDPRPQRDYIIQANPLGATEPVTVSWSPPRYRRNQFNP